MGTKVTETCKGRSIFTEIKYCALSWNLKLIITKMHGQQHIKIKKKVPALSARSAINVMFYTGCNRRNGPDFGRVFLRSNYTDITQNTYIQSSMVTEILAREV